jgi:hypothetical protein
MNLTGWPWLHPVIIDARLGVCDGTRPVAEIIATCAQCGPKDRPWRRPVANGHPGMDFTRLQYEHSGYRQCQARDCQAWIIDAITDPGGKRTVVDVGVAPKGNVALHFSRQEPGCWRARYLKGDDQPEEGEVRVMSHFATCTHPDQFRRHHPYGSMK